MEPSPSVEAEKFNISCEESVCYSDQAEQNHPEHTLFFNCVEDDTIQVSENEFFHALHLHQNTDETKIVCENEVLCVDDEKPMPTRYSQNMDDIVAKIQDTTGEILTEEYLIGTSSDSETDYESKIHSESSGNNLDENSILQKKRNKSIADRKNQKTKIYKVQNNLKHESENNNLRKKVDISKPEISKKLSNNASGKLTNSRMKMMRKMKQKLLSERSRILRSTKSIYPTKKEIYSMKNVVKKQRKIGDTPKSKKINENKPRIKLREKYLTDQEIETVKSAFKRLKETNTSLYSAFVRTDKNSVEIVKADIIDPLENERDNIVKFLNSCRKSVRNTDRIRRLKRDLKDGNTRDVSLEIVNSCKPPIEKQLKVIHNNVIHRSKSLMKRSVEVVDLDFRTNETNRNIFNNPTYSYRRAQKWNRNSLRTYTKQRNHLLKNKETKGSTIENGIRETEQPQKMESKIEILEVVELEPLYSDKAQNGIDNSETLEDDRYLDETTERYSPFDDTDIEVKTSMEAPLISRDPAMFQDEDYDEDIMSTPSHDSCYEIVEFSLGPSTENVETNGYYTVVESRISDETEDSFKEPTLTPLQPVNCFSPLSNIPEDTSNINKKSTYSAKIIRRAPIYQDAAKEDNIPVDTKSIEPPPSDTIFMLQDPTPVKEDHEGNDPYEFDDRDFTEGVKIEDTSDLLSELPRVIHNPKKKTCDKHGDRKAKVAAVYPCSKCLYIGSNVHNLERHMLTHMDPENIVWYACERCPYKTKYKHALKGHTDTHNEGNREKIFCCHLCNYKAHRKQNLNKHIYSAHNISKEELYQCYDCGKKFNTKAKLTNHINYMHSSSCEKCQFCNFVTLNKISLAAHVKNKHGDVERLFFCQQCTFKSKFPRDLDKHILRMHNRDQMKKYECSLCTFSTIYKNNMRYHMTHVHKTSIDEKTPPQFICGHCMKICNNKMALKGHIWQKHMTLSDDDYFKCEKCPFKSKVRRNLKRHVFLKHEQKGSKCPKCDFTTTRTASMLAHMVAHKKEKEKSKIYRCNECVYIAYTVSTMIYHMKKYHNKIVSHAELKNYLN